VSVLHYVSGMAFKAPVPPFDGSGELRAVGLGEGGGVADGEDGEWRVHGLTRWMDKVWKELGLRRNTDGLRLAAAISAPLGANMYPLFVLRMAAISSEVVMVVSGWLRLRSVPSGEDDLAVAFEDARLHDRDTLDASGLA
jgi:hypothetical protein